MSGHNSRVDIQLHDASRFVGSQGSEVIDIDEYGAHSILEGPGGRTHTLPEPFAPSQKILISSVAGGNDTIQLLVGDFENTGSKNKLVMTPSSFVVLESVVALVSGIRTNVWRVTGGTIAPSI